MHRKVAWLVIVERTGDCIDAANTRAAARASAADLADAMEPCVVVPYRYEWIPPRTQKKRRKGA